MENSKSFKGFFAEPLKLKRNNKSEVERNAFNRILEKMVDYIFMHAELF